MLVFDVMYFGVPLTHYHPIIIAQDISELHGDQRTWPAYVENIAKEWFIFNLAVSIAVLVCCVVVSDDVIRRLSYSRFSCLRTGSEFSLSASV